MELEGESPDVVQGSCQTMCPAAELRLRERERLLHVFEICQEDGKGGRSRPRADPQRMVKAFSRPAAGRVNPSPADVRPGPVLLDTVNYLFESVVPHSDTDWVQVYDFVFDRLRAVRQDAVLQALHGPTLIGLLEPIVRFHVYASYRLCDTPADQFDPVINDQHLLECLKQLLRLYTSCPGPHPHRPVFEAVYLLHNLGSQDSLTHGVGLPVPVRYALRVMSVAYSSKACQYPVTTLHRLLHLDTGHLRHLLQTCALLNDLEKISAQHVNFLKTKFSAPSKVERLKQPELTSQLEKVNVSSLLLGNLPDS